MSRVYFTASLPHEKFGIGLPTLSVETNDHTGGGYDVGGLHPTSIATLLGKGPDLPKQERFDLKFNLNAKRTSLSLVVNTTKHLPHYEWSSDGGAGKLPLAALGTLASHLFRSGQGPRARGGRGKKGSKDRGSRLNPKSPIYTSDGRKRQKPLEDKRRTSEKSKGRSSRGHSSSSSSPGHRPSRDKRHHPRQQKPRPSPSRQPAKRSRDSSRDSSRHSDHRRDSAARSTRPRRHDRSYDSGYASSEASGNSKDSESRGSTRQDSRRKTGSSRKKGTEGTE